MNIRRLSIFAPLVLTLAAPAALPAQDLFFVVKGQGFVQTGPTTTVPELSEPFGLESGIDGDGLGPAFPAPPNSFTPPGLPPVVLPFVVDDDEWFFRSLFDSKADLDLAFPNGLYSLISSGGSANLNINGDLYPNAPRATLTGGFWTGTFTGGYQIAPGTPLKITTNAFTTGFLRNSGLIEINIEQTSGPGGFDDGVTLFNPATGAPVTLNIPGGTLQANSTYNVELTFIRFTTVTTFNNNPDYQAIGAYLSMTSFDIIVSGPGGVAPIVTSQTDDVTVLAPATATFKVTAVGTGPFTYQWQASNNGVDFFDLSEGGHFFGTKTATLSVKNTNQFMTGLVLQCVISGPGGDTTSDPVTLTANAKPTIGTQPTNQAVLQGGTATFTVIALGSGPLNFQWKKNGVNIPGANTNMLEIDDVEGSDAGTYACVVSNGFGTVTSGPAKLTVATVPVITQQPRIIILIGLLLPAVTVDVKASGTAPLTYQWQFSKDNGATFSNLTNGNGVTGATGPSLKVPKAFFERESIAPDFPCIFQCVVSNGVGSVTSNTSTVIRGTPPAITTQPLPQMAVAGGSATFTIVATGSAPLNYQWKKNGVNIPGETNPALTISPVSGGDVASYSCVVTNGFGTVTSKPAKLTVALPPTITVQPRELVALLLPAVCTLSVKASGTGPLAYQWQFSKDGVNFTNLINGNGVTGATGPVLQANKAFFEKEGIELDTPCIFQCVVTNGVGSTTSNQSTVIPGAKPAIAMQPVNQTTVAGGTATFSVIASGSEALNYQWKKNGVNIPGEVDPTLTLDSVVAGDAASYTCVVTNPYGTVTSKPAKLTVALPPTITQQPQDKSVIAPTAATFMVKATGTAPLTYQWQISILGGNFTNLSNGGHFSGVTTATLKVSNTELPMSGLQFRCIVNNGTNLPATSDPATLNVGAKPTITTQPTGGSGVAGGNFTFTVNASGTGPLSFQWKKNGVNIPGQTNSTLALGPLGTGSAGSYSCVVSNAFGSVTSTAVKLAIAEPPGGIYFGTFSGGGASGNIAVLVSNNTAQILAFSQGGRSGAVAQNVMINANGTFTGTLQPGGILINGTATSAGFSGTFNNASGSGTFTGTRKSSSGFLQSSAGFFQGLQATVGGGFTIINPAGPSGDAYAIIAADGTMLLTFVGTGASSGASFGGTGKISNIFAMTGTVYPPGTGTFSIPGAMGTGGSGVQPDVTGSFMQGLTGIRGAFKIQRIAPLVP